MMEVVGPASLAAVVLVGTGDLDRPRTTGAAPGGLPSLVAVGRGKASAAAAVATLQLLLGPSPYEDEFTVGSRPPDGAVPGTAARRGPAA